MSQVLQSTGNAEMGFTDTADLKYAQSQSLLNTCSY